jgi:hypothetical protein
MLLFAAMASAQAVMTVTAGVLQVEQTVEVTYSNPNMKGQTVTIELNDGTRPTPTVVLLYIHLDQQGKGSTKWTAPMWWAAFFNGPGVNEIMRCIDCPDVQPSDASSSFSGTVGSSAS